MIKILFFILNASLIVCDQILYVNVTKNVIKSQVFVHQISPESLDWNTIEQKNEFHYVLARADGPDLPPWLFTKYVEKDNSMYIFGAPPVNIEEMELELRIGITSLLSYRTKSYKLLLSFLDNENDIKYEIFLRVSNANIESMLDLERPKSLIEVFENHFWEQSKGQLYLTFLASSEDLGFRLPPSPNDTTGVVLHIGSSMSFSEELINLQNETVPLSKHCPSFYKRITVERFFRPKDFIMDWCFFKLVNYHDCNSLYRSNSDKDSCNSKKFNTSNMILRDDIELLVEKKSLPKSDIQRMLIILVFVPSILLALGAISWLTSLMCFNHAKLYDPYSDDYFETVFYICEDFGRASRSYENSIYDDEIENKPSLFNF